MEVENINLSSISKNRVFVAIDFPDEVIKEFARVEELLLKWPFNGKVTEIENLHLTLKFLGEIDNEKLLKVKESLRKIEFDGFEASVGQMGVFSNRGMPRIVWVKINSRDLHQLQEKIESLLTSLGFKGELGFKAHVTIARIKYVKDKIGFMNHLKNIKPREIKFKLGKFSLKLSVLHRIGPVYSDLEVYFGKQS